MNTLKDSKAVNSPDPDMTKKDKPRTPLRKDELEKIARELKKKLQKASVAAKQLILLASALNLRNLPESPALQTAMPKLSPLKNYYMWKRQIAAGSPGVGLLPNLFSPGKSPTLTKPLIFLSSSPLRRKSESEEEPDSPIKRRRAESGAVREPQMILEEIPSTPPKNLAALHPLPVLTSNAKAAGQTTPTLPKRQPNLLKTPTQRRDGFNDEEGADLLMYLATSPSPAKPYATPRATSAPGGNSAPVTTMGKPSSAGQFLAPAPPQTPKRAMFSSAKTPQNRLTPSFHSLVVPGSALPSAGLALTPAGFSMSDYVNFFTPSPSAVGSAHANANKSFLKTPDFQGHVTSKPVDGKMINFDKVGLFGPQGSEQAKD